MRESILQHEHDFVDEKSSREAIASLGAGAEGGHWWSKMLPQNPVRLIQSTLYKIIRTDPRTIQNSLIVTKTTFYDDRDHRGNSKVCTYFNGYVSHHFRTCSIGLNLLPIQL